MSSPADTLDSPPSPSPTPSQVTLTVVDDASPDDVSPWLPILASETTHSTTSPPIPVIPRNFDPDFYFNGLFVIFEVEDYLFRVPTHLFFNESAYFVKLFKLPNLEDPEYASETIVLPAEIKREDFRNFLKALCPISVATKLILSESEWISVLKLSTKWRFNNLRQMAISELESFSSLASSNKIVLGRQCFILSWFQSGLTEIVNREETINDDEAIAVDYIMAIELFRCRELRLKSPFHYFHSQKKDIETKFAAEMASINTAAQEMGFMPKLYFHLGQENIQVVDEDQKEASSVGDPVPLPTSSKKKGKKRK